MQKRSRSEKSSQRQMYDALHGNISKDGQKDVTPFQLSKAYRAASTRPFLNVQKISQPIQNPVQGPTN
eukprot:6995737-Karenia_brevis.AAC.1